MRRNETILVVEDDRSLRHLYWQALTFEGFHVISAWDGIIALECLHHTRPSLVVLDLNVPGLPGGEILREMRAQPGMREIPVVVVTGADPADVAAQVAALFVKPVPVCQVVEEVQRQVNTA